MLIHPQKNEMGERVIIKEPSHPSSVSTWLDANSIASFTPFSAYPEGMHPVEFRPPQVNESIEKPFQFKSTHRTAAGVVLIEPDNRVWVVSPTNKFVYVNTFPKGGHDINEHLQYTAAREVYEESGLNIEIIDVLCDQIRGMSHIRYYLGRRISGCPCAMGWESQACSLVPLANLKDFVEREFDKEIVDILTSRVATTA